jgi:outer membrane immunogenic protein
MKRILFAGLSMTVLATASAFAADMPPRPEYKAPAAIAAAPTWTGCFIGGNVGAISADASITNVNTGDSIKSSNTNTGAAGGGQIGCNYQFNSGLVVGFRNMFDVTSLSKSATFPTGAFAGFTGTTKTQWFHTATARLGYAAMPNALIYLQGGAAWANTTQSITNAAGVQVADANNKSKTGYTLGGGFEYMLDRNWSAFIEYDYLGFGTDTRTTSTGIPVSAKADLQTVLLGVNYRFR